MSSRGCIESTFPRTHRHSLRCLITTGGIPHGTPPKSMRTPSVPCQPPHITQQIVWLSSCRNSTTGRNPSATKETGCDEGPVHGAPNLKWPLSGWTTPSPPHCTSQALHRSPDACGPYQSVNTNGIDDEAPGCALFHLDSRSTGFCSSLRILYLLLVDKPLSR